jgi:cellulose synthase (UDP-forming)
MAPVAVGASVGLAFGYGAWSATRVVALSASLLLAVVLVRGGYWLLRARRASRSDIRSWLVPGDPQARALVLAALRLILAASVIWLAWVAARSWQYWIVAASTLAIAVDVQRPLHEVLVMLHQVLVRRMPAVARTLGRAGRDPWIPIAHLVLANLVIALALLDTARFSVGQWALHTKIAFLLLCAADLLLVKTTFTGARLSRHASFTRNYVLAQASHQQQDARQPPEPATSQRGGSPRRARTRRIAASVAAAGATAWVAFQHPGPLVVLGAVVVAAGILSMTEVSRPRAITMLLAIGLGVSAIDYLGWRLAVTNWQGWWIGAPLLLAETLGAIHTVGYQLTIWPWPTPVIHPAGELTSYEIFILVPTVNEGTGILRPTIEGCLAARHQYLEQFPEGEVTVIVCNDGLVGGYPHWAEVEKLAAELGVQCVTRTIKGGAKAGNIENVRQQFKIVGDRLMVIFDADQVPKPEFLVNLVPPFADPKVGWVQSGQYYANLGNPVSNWADDQQSMFYNLLCPGKAAMEAAFICGTNVVIRGAALEEIGGLPQDSVTEDFSASIKLHSRWRSIYLTDVLATGLGPLDVPSYLKQQGRWALGTLTTFRSHFADIMLPKKNGLRLGQRVQYLLAATHYLCGLRDVIYLISPVLFIFTGVPALRTASLNEYMLHFIPYGVLGILGMWRTARGITGLRGVIIGFGSSPALINSLIAALLGRRKPFAITSKETGGRRSYWYLACYVAALLLCLAALGWATQVQGRQATSMFISLMWVCYSIGLLSSFLWLAFADIRAHRAGEAELLRKQAYPSKLHIRGSVVRPVLNLGLAALVASPVLLGARVAALPIFNFNPPAPPFVITAQQLGAARNVGVSLPIQELSSAPPALESELGASFSIIGRTQVLGDFFDTAWANSLASQGARPWITLQFGVFGANHTAPLSVTLPAIYNGVDDRALTRWADEIRAFGKPVFLTVLLQVDKNWAVTSAVANGGIPADVPKAWEHIRSVFRKAGADNVAWVWAPADPEHDQLYAPPAPTIDAVLQDFINYPGEHWGDPQAVLTNLARRYPGKPLFVEVATAGSGQRKAAWLTRLASAVEKSPQVYAVLWHEGGPVLNPNGAELKTWSETSDALSLATWRRMVQALQRQRNHH